MKLVGEEVKRGKGRKTMYSVRQEGIDYRKVHMFSRHIKILFWLGWKPLEGFKQVLGQACFSWRLENKGALIASPSNPSTEFIIFQWAFWVIYLCSLPSAITEHFIFTIVDEATAHSWMLESSKFYWSECGLTKAGWLVIFNVFWYLSS